MRCHDCLVDFEPQSGNLVLNDPLIGAFIVYNIDYLACPKCGEHLYTIEASQKIDDARKEQEERLIAGLPVGDFVSAHDAMALLGMTKQAFHKHHRIKRGFIYSIKIGGRAFYHKKSVELFRQSKDGRFPLMPTLKASIEYLLISKEIKFRTKELDTYRSIEIPPVVALMAGYDTEKIVLQ